MFDKQLNRRQFIKDTSLKLAGSTLILNQFGTKPAYAAKELPAQLSESPQMEYRTLGRTGLKVSTVSFGVMRLKEPAVLIKALDVGINYFDTAHGYQNGNNEIMLGKVLKEYGRKKALIATKIPPFHRVEGKFQITDRKTMETKMEKSLQRLQTDYVDVLFIHNIMNADWVTSDVVLSFAEKVKKEGKARFIGFSIHDPNVFVKSIDQAVKSNMYDAILAWFNFKSSPEHSAALKKAREANVGVVAMKTQYGGGYDKDASASVSPHQAALKWVLQSGFVDCAVPGMVNMEQVVENVGAVGKKISWSDRKVLHAAYNAIRHRYCVMCGKCNGTCNKTVDIHTVHRSLMYCEGYGDFELGRRTYLGLSNKDNVHACISCASPTCRCVNGINIAERMYRAQTLFV